MRFSRIFDLLLHAVGGVVLNGQVEGDWCIAVRGKGKANIGEFVGSQLTKQS